MFGHLRRTLCAEHFPAKMEEEFCISMQHSMPHMMMCLGAIALAFGMIQMFTGGVTRADLWHVRSVVAVFSFQIAASGIVMSTLFLSLVAQGKRVSRKTYELLICLHISMYFAIYPLCDRWRILRLIGDDMFKVFDQKYWDDTELTVGLAVCVSAFFYLYQFQVFKELDYYSWGMHGVCRHDHGSWGSRR